jgi:hypothetical protein
MKNQTTNNQPKDFTQLDVLSPKGIKIIILTTLSMFGMVACQIWAEGQPPSSQIQTGNACVDGGINLGLDRSELETACRGL